MTSLILFDSRYALISSLFCSVLCSNNFILFFDFDCDSWIFFNVLITGIMLSMLYVILPLSKKLHEKNDISFRWNLSAIYPLLIEFISLRSHQEMFNWCVCLREKIILHKCLLDNLTDLNVISTFCNAQDQANVKARIRFFWGNSIYPLQTNEISSFAFHYYLKAYLQLQCSYFKLRLIIIYYQQSCSWFCWAS